MKTEKEERLVEELQTALSRLERAGVQLITSNKKCNLIGYRSDLSNEELEVFDAFTSRFARVSDMLFQRVFRLLDSLEFEESNTLIDVLNHAEKRRIISSTVEFKEIRELRNEITHEYALRELGTLIHDVMKHTPILIDSVEKTIEYCKKY